MNIFGIGTWELLLIVIVALLVFGPRRLPEMARMAGKALRDLRNISQQFTSEWQEEISVVKELGQEAQEAIQSIKEPADAVSGPLQFTSQVLKDPKKAIAGQIISPGSAPPERPERSEEQPVETTIEGTASDVTDVTTEE